MKILSSCTALLLFLTALHVSAADLPAWIQQSRSAAAPRLSIPAFSKINAAIQNHGTARVIVRLAPPSTLATGFAIEGALKGAESVSKQRAEITRIQNNVRAILSTTRGTAAKRFRSIPFMAMEVDATEFSALAASSAIDLIEEDIPVPPTLMQSVPLIGGSSGSFNGYTGDDQTVAILDTGVDKSHHFLTGKVVSEACYSTSDLLNGVTSVCPSGSDSTATGSGVNCTVTGCEHGTHVAGIVAGNTTGLSGVAKDANLISIQVYSKFPATSCGSGATAPCIKSYSSDQIQGLERVYELRTSYNISSVNMSLGGGSYTSNCDTDSNYTAEKAAIDNLRSVGIATVIASGNGGTTNAISAPACISTAISVGATDKTDQVTSYSNSAEILNLLAPGHSIKSSIPGTSYAYMSGTSMATPHVAAAWAVLKSAKPTATVSEVLIALSSTGKSITDSRSSSNIVKPRIQLDAAINALKNNPINGACGSAHNQALNAAPTAGFCFSTGNTPSEVNGSGPWSWSCNGLNGGNVAGCLAYPTSQQVTISPFPQNFDSVTPPALPAGWSSSGTGTWQTNNGTKQPSGTSAHSLNNLVYFNAANITSGASALLASAPFSLSGRSGAKASFWMYHETLFTNTDRIDVYANTAATLSGATLLGSIYRYNGNAGWYQYTFSIPASFTGTTNYLLINGVSAGGNDIHLDDIQVTAFTPAYYQLGFNFAGSGYGSVNSAPAGINCSGTSGSNCTPTYFINGTSVGLSAASDSSSTYNSIFSGWTNDRSSCPGNGTCGVTMNGPVNVTGTFNREKLVKFSTQPSATYATILEAISAATIGQTIQLRDNSTLTPFADALNITKNISMTGGFDATFANDSGYTTSMGKLTISSGGLLKVQRIIIR